VRGTVLYGPLVGCGRIRGRALRFAWHGLLIDLWMPDGRRGRARLSARLRAYQGESTGRQRSGRISEAFGCGHVFGLCCRLEVTSVAMQPLWPLALM
jgi:hypothetical protein